MKTFLVGGAVRDALLGLPCGDRDWVVVGATPQTLLAQGYKTVGRDFPVFLHPSTGEEYALARTERKTGRGYLAFTVHAEPDVTLEQDLQRRDFTINAIAQTEDGQLIDPYNGAQDLKDRILRHVSDAFIEDPVRVLRAARFMARFAHLGFQLAPETNALMRQMAANGELNALVPERIWQELRRSLETAKPSAFLQTLRNTNALKHILPEVDALYGVPQPSKYHPEIDTGIHQEMVSDIAAQLAPGDSIIGFAALTHDLGKALTPPEKWPRHIGHEHAGLAPLQQLCQRLKVPVEHYQLAEIVCREHLNVHRIEQMRPASIYELLARCDAFRKPERILPLTIACEADKRGRGTNANVSYPQGLLLRQLHNAARAINARDINTQYLQGPQIGLALRRARIQAIAQCKPSPSL